MALNTRILDGEGSDREAGVTVDRALKVAPVTPSVDSLIESGEGERLASVHVYVDVFRDSSGSRSLRVDGSSVPVIFSVAAEEKRLKSIQEVRFIIHGSKMVYSGSQTKGFGSAYQNGLPNGLRFYAEQGGVETNIFERPVKSIGEFLNYATETINVSAAISSNVDLLISVVRLPAPVVLVPGIVDTLSIVVQDDLTSTLDFFEVLTLGSKQELA